MIHWHFRFTFSGIQHRLNKSTWLIDWLSIVVLGLVDGVWNRFCTILKKQSQSLAYLEQVRQHLARLPSIDPNTRTLVICGFPNVGKSSFMNKVPMQTFCSRPFCFQCTVVMITIFIGCLLDGDGICFACVAFSRIDSVNGSIQNLNAWRVLIGSRTLRRDFWVLTPKNLEPKNYLFSTTSQLSDNFEGQYLGRGTWYRQLGNGVGNYKGSPTSSKNFTNFGPLAAKNRTVVFTHPVKSAWQWWPSCWPALWWQSARIAPKL